MNQIISEIERIELSAKKKEENVDKQFSIGAAPIVSIFSCKCRGYIVDIHAVSSLGGK